MNKRQSAKLDLKSTNFRESKRWEARYKPARKTVARANDAHIPHFKWLGSICESVEWTASTFADSVAWSSGNMSFADRIAFKPNVPCSSSNGKRDWSLCVWHWIHQNFNKIEGGKCTKNPILIWKLNRKVAAFVVWAYYCWITE